MALKTLLHMQARGEKLQAALNQTLSDETGKTSASAEGLTKDKALAQDKVLAKDKALATELCYGCARLAIRLDWILNQHLKKPEQIPLALRRVLRLAAYELLYLTHIPVYAVISSYVGAVKAGFGPGLAGLANAVLRKIANSRPAEQTAAAQTISNQPVPGQSEPIQADAIQAEPTQATPQKKTNIPSYDEALFKERLTSKKGKEEDFLSKWYSLPPWLVTHFLQNYSREEALTYMQAFLSPPPLGLRVNSRAANWQELFQSLARREDCVFAKGNALALSLGAGGKAKTQPPEAFGEASAVNAEFETSPQPGLPSLPSQPGLPNAACLTNFGALLGVGALSRQSAAAQQVMQSIFDYLKQEIKAALELGPVWDLCAGHGGKTCWLLEQGYPVALASDVNLTRLLGLKQELKRLKLPSPLLLGANAARPMPLRANFDPTCSNMTRPGFILPGLVLIDAPCSGLGTLARRPDIKEYAQPSDLPALAALQRQILGCAFDQLPIKGLLVYITCTLNPQENEGALDSLLQQKPNARQIFTWQTPAASALKEFFWAGVVRKEIA